MANRPPRFGVLVKDGVLSEIEAHNHVIARIAAVNVETGQRFDIIDISRRKGRNVDEARLKRVDALRGFAQNLEVDVFRFRRRSQ